MATARGQTREAPATLDSQRMEITHLRPRVRRWSWPLLLLLALAASAARGQSTNDDCLACHSDPELTRAKDNTPVAVDPQHFADSVHGAFSCTDCHTDPGAAEPDHPPDLTPADCSACHGDQIAAAADGVHAQPRADGKGPLAACSDCHGLHDILSSTELASRTHPLNIPRTCGSCHGQATPAGPAGAKPHVDVLSSYLESVHGKGLTKSGLVISASCTSCHDHHQIRRIDDPKSQVFHSRVAKTCGVCHVGIEAVYATSIHGKKLAEGNDKAPSCADCHSSHTIPRAQTEAWRVDVMNECGTCHEHSMETYRDTFHGQVTKLGFARVATCSGCHGAHDVLPASDPASHISPERRLQTCQSCHESAPAGFVSYDPHANKHDRNRSPTVFWTSRLMSWLLIGTFGFFLTHTGLWFLSEVRQRKRGGAPEGQASGPREDRR